LDHFPRYTCLTEIFPSFPQFLQAKQGSRPYLTPIPSDVSPKDEVDCAVPFRGIIYSLYISCSPPECWLESLKGSDHSQNIDVVGGIILKLMLGKYGMGGVDWIKLVQDMD
jgi:hypothetical protein